MGYSFSPSGIPLFWWKSFPKLLCPQEQGTSQEGKGSLNTRDQPRGACCFPPPSHTPTADRIQAQKPEQWRRLPIVRVQKAQLRSVSTHPSERLSSVFTRLPWLCFLRQALSACQTRQLNNIFIFRHGSPSLFIPLPGSPPHWGSRERSLRTPAK